MDELLKILKNNALESPQNLAKMLDLSEAEVVAKIGEYEKQGVIRGYHAIVNEDQLDLERVRAVIEIRIAPEALASSRPILNTAAVIAFNSALESSSVLFVAYIPAEPRSIASPALAGCRATSCPVAVIVPTMSISSVV